MSETMYLFIATYDHEKYRELESQESNKLPAEFKLASRLPGFTPVPTLTKEAQDTAFRLFGGHPDYLVENQLPPIEPDEPVRNLFTFVGAFPYIPISVTDAYAEEKRSNNLYGWVAIVPGDKLDVLKEIMGWPDSPFCQVFNIMISEINPIKIEGNKPEDVKQDLKKRRDPEAWRQAGLDIYGKQTPAMWEG